MIFDPSPRIIVGITQRIDSVPGREELRDALDQRFSQWLVYAGFLPIVVPNTLSDSNHLSESTLGNWLEAVKPGALILSGGNDIGDFEQRDLTEKHLLSWAKKNRKPVLGICRGMQMMGVYAGGKLKEVDGHVRTRHQLQVKNSHSQSLPKLVNSYHNLALENCPDTFQILAESEDGNIEAMKHKELPWEGWMWHPEREEPFSKTDHENFKKLIKSGI